MNHRSLKDLLYEQVARIGKALASPKRLELLEMLAQGEKSVETLTAELSIDVKLTSAHLKALKAACLVQTRREGKYIFYRLSDDGVAQLGIALRTVAERHLDEMRQAMRQLVAAPKLLTPLTRPELLAQVRRGDVVVIDVRPRSEYDTAHLPHAISMPLAELERRIAELPQDRDIVAYCRGPFCMLSDESVRRLVSHGYRAQKTMDGVSEWRAAGVALESMPAVAGAV
jgi:rhodanese-related sulfurtransferase/DNA-binding transcriptional ArsR family regulator